MSSLELVDFINASRGPDEAELRHDHLLVKVPKVLSEMPPKFSGNIEKPLLNKVPPVLGAEGRQNFLDTHVNPQNGQTHTLYRLSKREACLMAMSYSYALQAEVYDRMTELEAAAAGPVVLMTLIESLRHGSAQAERAEVLSLEVMALALTAATQALEVQAQAVKIEAIAPAAAVGERVAQHRHRIHSPHKGSQEPQSPARPHSP